MVEQIVCIAGHLETVVFDEYAASLAAALAESAAAMTVAFVESAAAKAGTFAESADCCLLML